MSAAARIVRIGLAERPAYQARLAALERLATYPLGDDAFQLDHGPDYFAFFDRLGEVDYRAAVLADGALAAVGAGILRSVPFTRGAAPRRAWYGSDLKVHPDHRRSRLPLRMLARGFPCAWVRCRRGYGVSMDPPGGENPVVRLMSRFRWSPLSLATTLHLWSLDRDAVAAALPLVRERRGPVRLRSLEGVKDLVLRSTGACLPLLHVEWGPRDPALRDPSRALDDPAPDHTHMLCAPVGDPLERDLLARGLKPSARASVVARGMQGCDWTFVLTSEI